MSDKLKSQTIRALMWSFVERIGYQAIQFAVGLILARLLMPAEFGLIGMLMIFMAIAQAFVDSGFGQSLIQKQDVTKVDESSAFYFNIVIGGLATVVLWLMAPSIAAFYDRPILVPLTRVMSLNIFISSFGIVQTALMTKRVDFKTQMRVSLTGTLIGGAVGVAMALLGYGVWSLVTQSICATFLRTALLWLFHGWRPLWQFSFASLRDMFGFSSRLLFSGLLDTVFQNIYLIVIGKMFSATDLGYYTRAKTFQQLPVTNLSAAVNRVTFPVFSTIQADKPRLKRGVRKAIQTLAMANFPLMFGLAIVAKPLVNVLVTDKWAPCVPYLQLLCILGMLYPFHTVNLNVLKAQGRSDLYFRIEILKKLLVMVSIAICYRWGISALILGGIVTSLISLLLNTYYTSLFLDYPLREQVWDVVPYALLSALMAVVMWAIGRIPFSTDFFQLAMQCIAGSMTYVMLGYWSHPVAFVDIIQSISGLLKRSDRTCTFRS